MFKKLKQKFIKKGLILVVCNNSITMQNCVKHTIETQLNKDYYSSLKYYRTQQAIEYNGYNIKFISSVVGDTHTRGYRPEIVYWGVYKPSDNSHEMLKYLKSSLHCSSRKQPFREFDEQLVLGDDIMSDDFSFRKYIKINSYGFKVKCKEVLRDIFKRKND